MDITILRIDGVYIVNFGRTRFTASGWDLLRLKESIGFAVLDEDRVPGLRETERRL